MMCPPHYQWVGGQCIPGDSETPPYSGGKKGGQGCPPGQVPKTNGNGCKPEGQWWDESPDEKSTQGIETCDETEHPEPKECYWCDFDDAKWKRGWCGGAGGAGGGGGGGAKAAAATKPKYTWLENPLEQVIWNDIMGTLSGKNLPYSDETVAANKSALFGAVQGREQQGGRAIDESLISSGMFRSGARTQARGELARGSQQAYSKGVGDILAQKTVINYQARVDALGRAKGLLDSQRDFLLRSEGNDIARTQGLAQIQLGYATIANQMAMLQAQLRSNEGIAANQLSAAQLAAIMNQWPGSNAGYPGMPAPSSPSA